MSNRLGPIAFQKAQQQFLDGITNPHRQVKPIIDEAHQIALDVLSHY